MSRLPSTLTGSTLAGSEELANIREEWNLPRKIVTFGGLSGITTPADFKILHHSCLQLQFVNQKWRNSFHVISQNYFPAFTLF
jgi:hypothetical protein